MYEEKMPEQTKKTSGTAQKDRSGDYDYLGNSASAHDCTGLIPSGTVTEKELHSYEDLYSVLHPALKNMDHKKS